MKKTLIFVIVAILSLGLLTACGGGGGAAKEIEVLMGEGGEMKFNPATLSVKKGEKVAITIVNKDAAQDHTLVLTDFNVKSKTVKPGQKETLNFTASKTGEFNFQCDVPGHKDGGMVGKLTVTE